MKTTKTAPETRASASACYMKVEDIVDEVEPTRTLTLREKSNTAINQFIKKMTPVHSICNVYPKL